MGTSPAASTPASAASSAAATSAENVLSDQELMGLMDRAINGPRQGTGRVAKTGDLRTRLQGQPPPADRPAVEPGECSVFRPRSSPTSSADLDMNFAAGVLTLTGSWARDTLAFVFARSAPRSEVLAADFPYTDEQSGKCATFRQASANGPPTTVRLLPVPPLGEKAYAVHASPPATDAAPPAGGTISLKVLKGTVSFGLSRQPPVVTSDGELTAALEPLVRLAGKLLAEAPGGTPPANAPQASEQQSPRVPATPQAPAAPRQQTPEQLAALLQGITGPSGRPAQVLEAQYAPAPTASPPDAEPPACTYDDAAYLASLPGAATVVAEIPGAAQELDHISLRLISLPSSADPLPFDRRAADLGGCTAMQEKLPGGGSRTWSAPKHPIVDTSGQTGYAVVYTLGDGTGIRHVLVGARKGRLCEEAEAKTRSDGSVQQTADGLAATINKVMARVGS